MRRAGPGRRRRHVLACLGVALVATAAAPAVAQADRVWDGPVTLTRPGTYASGPVATVTSRGETVVAWVEQNVDDAFPMRLATAVRRADGTLESVRVLAAELAGCVLDIASDAAGNVVVSWELPDGTVKVARRPAGREFSAPEVLDRLPNDNGGSLPRLAMNPRGDAAIVWEDYVWAPTGPYVRFAGAFSPAGEPFSATRDLTGPQPVSFAGYDVAVAADGDMVTVFAHDPRSEDPAAVGPAWVKALTRRPDGTVTEPQTLALSATKRFLCPQAVADALGRVAAMWRAVDDRCWDYATVSVARRPPGGPFGEPAAIPVPAAGAAGATLTMANDGRMAVGYLAGDGPTVRTAPFDGPFGPPTVLPTRQWAVPAVSQGLGGRILAGVWDVSDANESFEIDRGGGLAGRQDLPFDCATRVQYALPVVGPQGHGALLIVREGAQLELSVDRASTSSGPSACAAGAPAPPGPAPPPPSPSEPSPPGPSPPGSPPSQPSDPGAAAPGPFVGDDRGTPPPAPAPVAPDPELVVTLTPARLAALGAAPYVDLQAKCSEPCVIEARGSLVATNAIVARAHARTPMARRDARLRLRFRPARGRRIRQSGTSAAITLTARDRLGRSATRRVVARPAMRAVR